MKQILIKKLVKYYGRNLVLDNINLVLNANYIYFLTSENGSGKTTFFKCLLRETSFNGMIDDNKLDYVYLPEKVNIPSYIRLMDYLKMYLSLDYNYLIEDEILDYLKKFGILSYQNMFMHELSKGTKQKVLITKTLLSKGDVFLFDEPLSGLDRKSRSVFISLVNLLHEKGNIIIIASHYYDEYDLCNKKVIELNEIS